MPSALIDKPLQPIPQQPPRKRWTRAECDFLQSSGLFDQEHLELVEGELINKMGQNRPHSISMALMHGWLMGVFGILYVQQNASIDVAPQDNPTSEPEPDLIVLTKPVGEFPKSNPGPKDLRLVVEISDTSLDHDRTKKAGLYARAEITDYWVLDVNKRRLIVHRDPKDGSYKSIVAYGEQESVSPLAAPGREFRVTDAFAG